MLNNGMLVRVNAEMLDGSVAEQVVHRDSLPLLERAADGDITPRHTTFLSPFDSLFWAQGRDMQFWASAKRSRHTSQRPSVSGATSVCPSCTAASWSGASTPSSSVAPGRCASSACIWKSECSRMTP